eukprot:747323-Hanusia_phi.AAC.3
MSTGGYLSMLALHPPLSRPDPFPAFSPRSPLQLAAAVTGNLRRSKPSSFPVYPSSFSRRNTIIVSSSSPCDHALLSSIDFAAALFPFVPHLLFLALLISSPPLLLSWAPLSPETLEFSHILFSCTPPTSSTLLLSLSLIFPSLAPMLLFFASSQCTRATPQGNPTLPYLILDPPYSQHYPCNIRCLTSTWYFLAMSWLKQPVPITHTLQGPILGLPLPIHLTLLPPHVLLYLEAE